MCASCLISEPTSFKLLTLDIRWRWLGDLKQPDGGFQMSVGGEEDVR